MLFTKSNPLLFQVVVNGESLTKLVDHAKYSSRGNDHALDTFCIDCF